jgi:glutamate synthase domain-containing protein 2
MPLPSCSSTRNNSYATYREYAQIINDQSQRHMTLRGLFEFKFDQCAPVPIEEVEPGKEIVKRFATSAMSLGSLSTKAHTNLAIAMNRTAASPTPVGAGGRRALP